MLLQKMLTTLESNNVRGFCLDSGYKNAHFNLAEKIWQIKCYNLEKSLFDVLNNDQQRSLQDNLSSNLQLASL